MLLHGDLKSYNILVKGDFQICKLCDFGVSLPLNKEGKVDFGQSPLLEYVGTNLWSAPEIIAEEDVIDCKVDIFSLGLVVYETITLHPPHTLPIKDDQLDVKENDVDCDESCSDVDSDSMTMLEMALGTRPALPEAFELSDEYNILMELFYLCTNEIPADRPSAIIICNSLQNTNC